MLTKGWIVWIVLLAVFFGFGDTQNDDPYAHCECKNITGRVSHYGNIPSRTAILNGQETPLTRHHIIPVNVLTDFGNLLVQGEIDETLRNAADSLIHAMYSHYEGRDAIEFFPAGPSGQVNRLQNAVVVDRVSTAIHSFYHWLPGNIFYGPPPNLRSDDPGSGFETNARYILGNSLFDQIQSLYDRIVRFIASPDNRSFTQYERIITGLSQLFNAREAFPFNVDRWVHESDGRYRIRLSHNELKFVELDDSFALNKASITSYYSPEVYTQLQSRLKLLRIDKTEPYCLQMVLCRDATIEKSTYFNYAVVGM